MTIWTTNLVLELNTGRNAVRWRELGPEPALVFAEPHVESQPLYKEPLISYWGRGGSHINYIDPEGLPARFSRHMVIANHGKYFEVASAASTDGRIIEEWRVEIRRRLENAIREMKALDIVFLIDRSESMKEAISETTGLLQDIAGALRVHRVGGAKVRVPSLDIGEHHFVVKTDLDLRVSVLTFEKTPTVMLRPTSIGSMDNWELVKRTMDYIQERLEGGTELVHPALLGALNTDLWRSYSVDRLIVLITDEQGDVGPDMTAEAWTEKIFNAMPDTEDIDGLTKEVVDREPEFRDKPERERKKALTTILAAFFGDPKVWSQFSANLGEFSVVKGIFNFGHRSQGVDLKTEVVEHLEKKKERIESRIEYIASMLEGKLTAAEAQAWSTAGGLTRAGLWAALERNDLTENQVRKLGELVYYHGYVPVNRVLQRSPDTEDGRDVEAQESRRRP